MPSIEDSSENASRADTARLLSAINFAAKKHRDQRRKDREASPYINHPIEVATTLANIGGVSDVTTLIAGVLHDTVEDTQTTPAELETAFGAEVRALVGELTDDKGLPKAVRKQLQVDHAPHASNGAKLIKLGDKICNVRDVTHAPPTDWTTTRRREYFDWTERVVAGCRGTNVALERYYDALLLAGRAALDE